MNIIEIKQTCDKLFGERSTLMSTWQEIANNFYPERADFTYQRTLGSEFAGDLLSSYPIMIRRDLGNQLGSMLRPAGAEWFDMGLTDDDYLDTEGKQFFDWVTKLMRREMYDRKSKFTRATKEEDHDYACFGQSVISTTPNRYADHLLYKCWHIKDCAWQENYDGDITFFVRKWKSKARDLVNTFRDKVDPKVTRLASKEPFAEVLCYHIVCEADYYDEKTDKPYWSLFYDCDHEKLIEATAMFDFEYSVSRWETVSGSQYAYSPATITALPDARLIQSITLTLLEAGEKAVNPPLVATSDAIKSDAALYAGGITWVDRDYDERLGDALRPLTQDFRGLPYGFEMIGDVREMIRSCFYLDKLALPINAPEMTAFEVGQRVSDYIRQAMPIFEPMEIDRNGQLCEQTFQRMLRMGKFGDIKNKLPKSLSGKPYMFSFQSPLHEAIEAQKGQKFQHAQGLLAEAAALDGTATAILDVKTAIRDSLEGIGIPAKWTRSVQDVEEIEQSNQAQAQQQAELDKMEQGAEIAAKVASANG